MKERAEEVCQSSAGHTDEEDFFLTNSKRQSPHDASAGQIGNVLTVCVRACVRVCVCVCVHRCPLRARMWLGQALSGG